MLVSRMWWLTIIVFVVGLFSFIIGISAVEAGNPWYRGVTWQCYDGTSGRQGDSTTCKFIDDWVKIAETACARLCDRATGRCGLATYNTTTECTQTLSKVCTETDRGNDKMNKGTNTINYTDGTFYTSGSDYCYDQNTVAEFTCNGDQWDISYERCGEGYTCNLGACQAVVVAKSTCRDTDGGSDVFTKGTLSVYTSTGGYQTVIESCADRNTMDELVCFTDDPTSAYVHRKTTCANGCSDGACLKDVVVTYDRTAKSTIIAPFNDMILTNYPRTAEVQWIPITSASKYELEVACDYCGSTQWGSVNTWTSTGVYLTTPALAGDNQFRTRVRAVYPDNTYSQWSDYVYFKYKVPTQPTVAPLTTEPTADPTAEPISVPGTETDSTEEPPSVQPTSDSKPIAAPKVKERVVGRMSCGNSAGGDGLYSACKNDTIRHSSGITFKVRTYDNNNVWLVIGKGTTKYIRVPFKGSVEVKKSNGEMILKATYVKRSPKYGVFLEIETALGADISKEELIKIRETRELSTGSMLPTYDETQSYVTFFVSVNDFPAHQDYSKLKVLSNAFVNMYSVVLASDGTFKVSNYETASTGVGENPAARFIIKSGQMVYFEGFKTAAGAEAGATKMITQSLVIPPYKNFSSVANKLCQTNFDKIDEFYGGSPTSACTQTLNTPYLD